jgi:predicted metal-dependent HD superfamily phosphohydrolase
VTPALLAAYAEPHRRYHTLAHVEACLAELAAVPDLGVRDERLLRHALWWHDAVYDPRAGDNEARSAHWARAELDLPPDEVDEVARLVLLTAGHRVEPGDRLGALMASIDLSVLGASAEVYDAYAAGVRCEYAHVPDDAFRAGRARVLRHFLDAETLFPDPAFAARLEGAARANLARELAGLGAPPV